MASTPTQRPTAVITAEPLGLLAVLREMGRYRDLFVFLIWRDVSVRYKQTVLGLLWVALQPLIVAALFTGLKIALGATGARGATEEMITLFCSFWVWTFFAQALGRASRSLVGNSVLVTKVYFPRMIIPLASALSGLVDLAVGFVIALGFVLWGASLDGAAIVIGPQLAALPLVLALALALAIGLGLLFAALNVRFRDVGVLLDYVLQVAMHASAVWWTVDSVSENLPFAADLVGLNPLIGLMEAARWSLLGAPLNPTHLWFTVGFAALSLVVGQFYFMRSERTFADVI